MSADSEIMDTAERRQNELARLIFAATDLSAVHRLRRYLARHPALWLTLSEPVGSAVRDLLWETHRIEYLVNGPACGFHYRPDCFSLYSF